MRAQAGAASTVLLVSLFLGGALLGAPSQASAEGVVTFLRMTADRCPESSGCEWRLSCGVGGPQLTELLSGATARTKYSVDIKKPLEIKSFPATIKCTAWEDDGWFSSTWEEVGTATLEVAAGGDYKISIANKEQGALHVDMAVDSLEISAAPPAAAKPAAPAKKGAAPAKTPPATQVIGSFVPQAEGHAVVIGLDEKAFKDKVAQYSSLGLQLDDVESFLSGGKRVWSGIFKDSSDQVQLIIGQDWDKFANSWKKLTGGNMRLTDLEVYPGADKNYFAGVFRDLGKSHALWVGQTKKDFVAKVNELASYKNQKLLDVQPYGSGTNTLYAGTFREDPNATELWTGVKLADFQNKVNGVRSKNMALVDIETYKEGKDRLVDAIVRTGTPGDLVMGTDLNGFAKRWRDEIGKGQRLISLEIYQE